MIRRLDFQSNHSRQIGDPSRSLYLLSKHQVEVMLLKMSLEGLRMHWSNNGQVVQSTLFSLQMRLAMEQNTMT